MPDTDTFEWNVQITPFELSPPPPVVPPLLPDSYWEMMWFEQPEAGTIIPDGHDLNGVGGSFW